MKYLIGIGNPGERYRLTRHNVGYRVVDQCQENWAQRLEIKKAAQWKEDRKLQALKAVFDDCILLKPVTFVNETGRTAEALMQNQEVGPAQILVVCDDVNLILGKMRLRASGSAGGHHGLESLVEHLGTGDFARLRIGVGAKEDLPKDLTQYVLGRFGRQEVQEIKTSIERAEAICRTWVEEGIEAASRVLSRLQS